MAQESVEKLFGQVANQRKGDIRSTELVNDVRRALVARFTDPKATPSEKADATKMFELARTTTGAWQSNPKTAPGYDPALDMPEAKVGQWKLK